MTLESAIEVFVRAFAKGRSQAHPYDVERLEGLWVMRDAPGRKDPRKIEVVTSGVPAGEVVKRVRELGLGWHFVCDVHPSAEDPQRIRAEFKAQGYRALTTEWMFVHDLDHIPVFESEPPARLAVTQAELEKIQQVAQHKRKVREGIRLYGVWDDDRDYGWVESIEVGHDAWVSALHVFREHRGKGYGSSLMSALLQGDRANNVRTSVLLASTSGARLYPHLGYEKIATLQAFCPVDRRGG